MGILDNAKEPAGLVKKYNDFDLYQKILDLCDEIFQLREDNHDLRNTMGDLSFAQEISGQCFPPTIDFRSVQSHCK